MLIEGCPTEQVLSNVGLPELISDLHDDWQVHAYFLEE